MEGEDDALPVLAPWPGLGYTDRMTNVYRLLYRNVPREIPLQASTGTHPTPPAEKEAGPGRRRNLDRGLAGAQESRGLRRHLWPPSSGRRKCPLLGVAPTPKATLQILVVWR